MSRPVALILGAGANIGQGTADAFLVEGYSVALVSRKPDNTRTAPNTIKIAGNLSKPESVREIFAKAEEQLGIPEVVVYSAAAFTANYKLDPLSLSFEHFSRDMNIKTYSAYVAMQESVKSFAQLPEAAFKTFIYTGNLLNEATMAGLMALGTGKTATAHVIETAAAAYQDRTLKFYYADERLSDGTPPFMNIDGEAHGKLYVELAGHKKQGPWQQTFVKGEGYRSFK